MSINKFTFRFYNKLRTIVSLCFRFFNGSLYTIVSVPCFKIR